MVTATVLAPRSFDWSRLDESPESDLETEGAR
jgi:hypothetical protein